MRLEVGHTFWYTESLSETDKHGYLLFVAAPPVFSPAQFVFRLKGATARLLRQEFAHLRRMPSLWTTSYFVSTAGNLAAETIERYFQAQSTRA